MIFSPTFAAVMLRFSAMGLLSAMLLAPLLPAQDTFLSSANETSQISSSTPMPDQTFLDQNLENVDAAATLPAKTESVANSPAVTTTQGGALSSVPRRFHYTFGLAMNGIYDDNINVSHFDQRSDFFVSIDPQLLLGFGDIIGRTETFLRLEYTPSLQLYAENSDFDAFQQIARIDAQHTISRLTLTMGGLVERLDSTYVVDFSNDGTRVNQVNVDVSHRTRLELIAVTLGASYDLSSKTFISADANYASSNYNNLISSSVFSGDAYLNYRYSPKLIVGLGAGGGRSVVDDPDPDETFEQAGVRLIYQATGKLDFTANGGVEFRQTEQGANSSANFVSPVFDVTAGYRPFDGTKISLTTARRTLNSAVLSGQDYDQTSVTFNLRQRLLRRFDLGFTFTYQNLAYFSTTNVTSSRQDNYYSAGPSLDVSMTRFWTVGAFYNRRQDNSSLANFSFEDNQVGIRTSLKF